jgi:hypothetical protein
MSEFFRNEFWGHEPTNPPQRLGADRPGPLRCRFRKLLDPAQSLRVSAALGAARNARRVAGPRDALGVRLRLREFEFADCGNTDAAVENRLPRRESAQIGLARGE